MKNKPLCLTLCCLITFAARISAADIFVSPVGNDFNSGSAGQPKATLASALRQARELRRLNDPSVKGGIHIIIKGGTYFLNEPVFIRPEDSGTADSPTYIEAARGEYPVFSGGVPVDGWKPVKGNLPGLPAAAKGNVWMADIPAVNSSMIHFRQLWVDGIKAIRARDVNGDSMNRILSWNHQEQTCWIPKPAVSGLGNAKGMEMLIHQWWAIAILRIRTIEVKGDSAKLSFYQPESRVQSEHPWPAPWLSKKTGNSAFYLSNAIQFLDSPGEWFLDEKLQRIYYWPRKGEDLAKAEVIAPQLETLLKMEGTADSPVSYVFLKGLSFEHSGWLRPSQQGHVPHQAGMYMTDAYKLKIPGTPDKAGLENQAWVGRPAAAVEACFTNHTGFEACRFQHLASTGLDYKRGAYYDEIKGNLFKDIGGTGIMTGVFSDESVEVHLPYNPKDDREVCTGMLISNNLVTDVTNEDWGCVGIGAGNVRGIHIEHNEICDVSYSGISMGWGWTKTINAMRNNIISGNKISHYAKHLYDVAAIYTLSAQPGSVISSNYVDSVYTAPYAHDPNHWFYLYTDEGSSYFTVKDNWCPAEKFLQNANGPGNVWSNNGPQVADSVKKNAGIQAAYHYLLPEKIYSAGWPIKHLYITPVQGKHSLMNRQAVIEIVANDAAGAGSAGLAALCKEYNMSSSDVYNWNNHYVIFGNLFDKDGLIKRLGSLFPGAVINVYDKPFYEFNRRYCSDQELADSWQNIILTASLVKDPGLQQEYLQHHATQFTKWPEVAAGFCHANFQQLLVFRNERQLMLVISIPQGSSLDELNPKTWENNPKVDEWNAMMKKYQEGIPGTKPGESWVFLKPLAGQ